MTTVNLDIWGYCSHCETDIMYCPRCGNRTCNGGVGRSKLGDFNLPGTIYDGCYQCEKTHKKCQSHGWKAPEDALFIESREELLELLKENLEYFKEKENTNGTLR